MINMQIKGRRDSLSLNLAQMTWKRWPSLLARLLCGHATNGQPEASDKSLVKPDWQDECNCRLTGNASKERGSPQNFLWGMCQPRNFCGARRPPNPPDVLPARFDTAGPRSTKGMVAHMTCSCEENSRLKRSGVKRWSRDYYSPGAEPSCVVAYAPSNRSGCT